MTGRRTLLEGVKAEKAVDRTVEEQFVFAGKEKAAAAQQPSPDSVPENTKGQGPVGRVGLTIRLRSDYAAALKRASLQRRLNEVFPNTIQDIFEEALEPWLRTHGYLS